MENPELEDMANRESLTMNESFFIFQDILKEAVTLFEYDRQYIYREYRRWTEEKEKQFSPVVERVKAQVKSKRKQKNSGQGNDSGTYNSEEDPVREAVQRNSGTVSVDVDRKTGFGLILEFPTEG